jgi:hypothetical protein
MPSQYGKIGLIAGQKTQNDLGGTGLSGIVIGNESGLTVTVEMEGTGGKWTLYPGTVDFFSVPVNKQWNGNLLLSPSADLNNSSFWPGSYCYVDTYGIGERPSGTYPLSLNRANNLGNQVTVVSGSSTNVQNDNNAAGTSVVESTVLGSPSSNTEIFNDGSGWFGRWVNPTFTKIFQWFSVGSTALQLAAAGLLTEVLGNLKVDGTTNLVGNVTMNGTASFNNGNSSIDGSNNFNGNAVNVNAVNTGAVSNTGNETVGGTLGVTGATTLSSVAITGTETHNNNQSIQWKDSGGTARNVLNVDASNNLNIVGIAGTNLLRMLNSDGSTVEHSFDLSNGIWTPTGHQQSVNGDTSGSMTITEIIGGNVKLAIIFQNGYRQAGAKQMFTLTKSFSNVVGVINFGCGGIECDSGGSSQTINEVTWGTGTSAGSTAATTQVQTQAAGFVIHAVDAIGSIGGYASGHTGIAIIIGQ